MSTDEHTLPNYRKIETESSETNKKEAKSMCMCARNGKGTCRSILRY